MKLGDHIRTLANGRFDHAIDCGDMTVIHLVPAPGEAGRAEVRRSRLSDFTAGAERVEAVTHVQRGYAPRMVVARAFSRLGDSAAWAMFPSAEHFAAWCVNGQAPAPAAGPAAAEPPAPAATRPARKARPKARKRAAPRQARPKRPARRKAPARPKAKRPARKARGASRGAARARARKRR